MVYEEKKETPVTGVLGTTFGGTALAGMLGLFGGNGLGGLFGNNQNPATNPIYMLAQKDTVIAKLESERYTDAQTRELLSELSNVKQRLAAIEVAEPLREQNLQMQIGSVQGTIARLTQTMVPNYNVAYPAPLPTFSVNPTVQSGTTVTPTTSGN